MQTYLVVFIGAGVGGAIRHFLNQISSLYLGVGFPFGTLIVNVLGSLLMGMVISIFAIKGEYFQHSRLFLTTGVLGGFTTFSAYSLELVMFYERGQNMLALEYALASVIFSFSATLVGMWMTKTIFF